MTLQVVDPKSLRKLLKRVEELPEIKKFLEDVVEQNKPDRPAGSTGYGPDYITRFLEIPVGADQALQLLVKKVKENSGLTNLLKEIQDLMRADDFEGAAKVAKRVLEVPQAVSGKPAGNRP